MSDPNPILIPDLTFLYNQIKSGGNDTVLNTSLCDPNVQKIIRFIKTKIEDANAQGLTNVVLFYDEYEREWDAKPVFVGDVWLPEFVFTAAGFKCEFFGQSRYSDPYWHFSW
jgi:hypothetical protein